jgi:23S rRNA pseudouridine955/2504/2580 synthase
VKHIIEVNPALNSSDVKSVTVGEDSSGQRLDNYLIKLLKGVPKTHVYRIIRSGEVRVNKGRAAADTRIEAGDVVRVPPVRVSLRSGVESQAAAHPAAAAAGKQAAKNFRILFEDEHLLAIDKPAGTAVHGGSGISFGVIEQLRLARPEARFLELVHRLDRETSGVLLVAKKRSALKALQDQFRQRETGKTYLALVLGRWPARKKVLDQPLHKYLLPAGDEQHAEGERRVKVVARDDPDGMPSVTLVKVRATSEPKAEPAFSLLEVTIKTGRTHQIRVHLSAEGMPIAGDDKYGNFEVNKALARATGAGSLKRMFLHAWRLQVSHPQTGEPLEVRAELPADLSAFLLFALPA